MRYADDRPPPPLLFLFFFLSETKGRVSFVSSFSDVASKALSTLIMDERGTGRYFWPRSVDGHNLIVLASLFTCGEAEQV